MEFMQLVARIVGPHRSDWRLASLPTGGAAAGSSGSATIEPAGGRFYLMHRPNGRAGSERPMPIDYVGAGNGRPVTLSSSGASSGSGGRSRPVSGTMDVPLASGVIFRTPLLGKSGELTRESLFGPAILLWTPGPLSLVIFGATLASFAGKPDPFTALSTAKAVTFQPAPRKPVRGGSLVHELQVVPLAKAA